MTTEKDFLFEDLLEIFEHMEKIHPNLFFHITKTRFEKELEKSKKKLG